jgi:phospholipid N-methyltransferase
MGFLSEYAAFFRQVRHNFYHTGAILPSSANLGRVVSRTMLGRRAPMRMLEVGPGTGSVTRVIAGRMQPGDRFDAVEINPRFVEHLQQRLHADRVLSAHRDAIRIIEAPVQDLPGEGVYDLIISGLPLNNFSPELIDTIFAAFRRLLAPGGLLTYFEYAFIRRLKFPFVGRKERQRLREIDQLLKGYLQQYQVGREHVWFNVPPAVVRRLRLPPAPAPGPGAGVA